MKTVKVQICAGTHCTMMGAMDIFEMVDNLKNEQQEPRIKVELIKCCGDCEDGLAPVVFVNHRKLTAATSEKVMETIMEVGRT